MDSMSKLLDDVEAAKVTNEDAKFIKQFLFGDKRFDKVKKEAEKSYNGYVGYCAQEELMDKIDFPPSEEDFENFRAILAMFDDIDSFDYNVMKDKMNEFSNEFLLGNKQASYSGFYDQTKDGKLLNNIDEFCDYAYDLINESDEVNDDIKKLYMPGVFYDKQDKNGKEIYGICFSDTEGSTNEEERMKVVNLLKKNLRHGKIKKEIH